MGGLLRISAACALVAAQIPAQVSAASRTFFEERLLDRAPIVIRARFDADQSCFDVDVAAFKVVQKLRGDVDDRILVLGATQLSQRLRNIDRLLFLRREPSGCLYKIVDVVDLAEEADGIEALVRAFLVLSNEAEPIRRRSGLKQLIQDGLAMKSEFPRRLAARELDRLARRIPPVLTIEEVIDFGRAAQVVPADETARTQQALDVAENALLGRFAGTQNAVPPGAKRNLYLRAVAAYLRAVEPARREAAADAVALKFGELSAPFLVKLLEDDAMRDRGLVHLGAMQWRGATKSLIGRLDSGAADPGPIIACLGEIGDEAAVPAVSRYLSTADHFDAAVLALVRMDGPASRRTLEAMLAQLRTDPRQQPRIETIERARSRDFIDEDTARRLEAKGRYPRE
jgi:hypothetical protein